MKKFLYIISVSLFIALLLTSCAPAFPEEIDMESEQIKDLEGMSLSAVDFTDCKVDYYYYVFGFNKHLILGHMPANTVKKFIQCLNNAEFSSEPGNEYIPLDGDLGRPAFRIILNTDEVIYIECDDECCNPDFLWINGTLCQCDDETASKLRDWTVESTPGLKNYLNFLYLEREGKI